MNELTHESTDPSAETRYNLASDLFATHRSAEALQYLLPPLMVFELPRTLVLRARCLQSLNRHAQAIVDCRAYLAQDTEDPESNGLLALLLYEHEERGTARRHIDSALRRNPTQCDALLTTALLQFDSEQDDLALATFEKLLGAHPSCGRAWLGLALIELGRSQVKAAKRDILFALRYASDQVGTWHALAWIEITLGNIADAEGAFQQALAVDPNFGETYGGLAVIAALRGEADAAHGLIQRSLKLDRDSMSARYAEMVLLGDAKASLNREQIVRISRQGVARPLGSR